MFDVPECFRHAPGVDDEGKRRAAKYLSERMADARVDDRSLAGLAGMDIQTVQSFLAGKTWPWPDTRTRIEDALGLRSGSLQAAARGLFDEPEEVDRVVAAVKAADLTQGQKYRLLGLYHDMIEGREKSDAG